MKDLLKRIVIILVSGLFLGYLAYMFFTGKIIVGQEFLEFNTLYTIILAAVGTYLLVLFGIHPMYMKINKISLFVMGIGLVLMGNVVLINNSDSYIYISDFVKILGSFLTVLAWTPFFVSTKAKKEKESNNLEIIEV